MIAQWCYYLLYIQCNIIYYISVYTAPQDAHKTYSLVLQIYFNDLKFRYKALSEVFIRTKYIANNAQFSTLHSTAPFLSYGNSTCTSSKLETDTGLGGTDPAAADSLVPSATTATALVTSCLYHLPRTQYY